MIIAAAALLAIPAATHAVPLETQTEAVAVAADQATAKHPRPKPKCASSARSKVMPHMTTYDIMMPQPAAPPTAPPAPAPPTS